MADEEELTAEEAQAAFEMPYDNQQPRSQMSLARAATVAAVSPANRRHLRALPFRPLEYRRADGSGHRELPHESDADNWVPPPPAYTAKAEEAESVSLSHPNAPPTGRRSSRGSGSRSGVPPVPPLPAMSATVNPSQLSPSGPYQNPGQSMSATDLSIRRPSLVHPTTHPSPHSSDSIHRRGSAAQFPPQLLSYIPPPQPQALPQPTTSTALPTRRPSMFSRRAIESTIDIPPPPLMDPDAHRRGSTPLVPLAAGHPQAAPVQRRLVPPQERPLPPNPPLNPTNTPVPRQPNSLPAHDTSMRHQLPRLVPPVQQMQVPQQGYGVPMSAPPRTNAYMAAQSEFQGRMQGPHTQESTRVQSEMIVQSAAPRLGGRTGIRETGGGGKKEEKGKRRMGCVVM